MRTLGSLSFVSIALLSACGVLGACSSGPETDAQSEAALGDPSTRELNLQDVQRALRAAGATWTAGDTSVSGLSKDARTMMMGVPLSELDEEEVVIKEELAPAQAQRVPAALDWRDRDGKNFVSPIQDQGRCGSCVAFAAVGTFETQLNIAAQDTSSPWQLSQQYLFACGGGGCGFGWMVPAAAKFVVNKGVPDNACMPYTSGSHGDNARCQTACADAPTRAIKAQSYTVPSAGGVNVAAVKRALMNGPLMASMTVYDDLMFYTGGVYKHVTGNRAGGHAVSIVGWSDADEAWVVRNSWGAGWGEQGYFRIAWNDASGVGTRTHGLEVAPPGPYVTIADLRDGALLSGQKELAFGSQSLGGSPISWSLTGANSPGAQGVSGDGVSAVLDTTTVADGVYTLRPHARTGVSRIDGPPHIVYILNGVETGDIRFTTLTAGQTLTGTAKFDVAVTAAPVPATHVEWTITNAAGKEIVNRTVGNTGSLIQLGWNTKKWPNGTYTIKVTGGAGTQMLKPAVVTVTVSNPTT
jgi:hypothetical protein